VKVATIYFERIGSLHGTEWCNLSRPFSDATLAIAKMRPDDGVGSPETRTTGVKAVAASLVREISLRSRPEGCDAHLNIAATGAGVTADVTEPAPNRTSKYVFEQKSGATTQTTTIPAGMRYQVFIQYLLDGLVTATTDELRRAGQIRFHAAATASCHCAVASARKVRSMDRREALFLKELAHQSECRPLVAPALNQHVENLALVINGTPQIHPLARDANDHLVEVPPVARAWAGPPKPSGKPGPEFQNPAPHRFIGNLQAALGEEFFNVPVAQCEPEIRPDGVLG
jgi:hypothetical protein